MQSDENKLFLRCMRYDFDELLFYTKMQLRNDVEIFDIYESFKLFKMILFFGILMF